ncbi:MAG: ribonuclease P protein component 1 [Candidatus Micrarchaeia archaeon]|jgi:ribonuclease P protein subunit POP4
MQINNKNIVLSELIGLKAKIVKSLDKKEKGIEGKVIDETKNMLILETSHGIKKIPKKRAVFKFYVGNKSFTVKGEEISFRPYERTEKALKYYKLRRLVD